MHRQGDSVPPWCVRLCCSHSPTHENSLPVSRPWNPTPEPLLGITSGWWPSWGDVVLSSSLLLLLLFPEVHLAAFYGLLVAAATRKTAQRIVPGTWSSRGFPLLRCRGSIAVAWCRIPRYVPPHCISSSTCCGLARGSPLPYGQNLGSGSTGWAPFSCAPCKIPTQSWCGPPWEVSRLLPPPIARMLFCFLYRVSSLGKP